MKIIGLTGGIGSGKTTVADIFCKLGISCYSSDERAKFLMNHSLDIKSALIDLFGNECYHDKGLNKTYLSKIIFNDTKALAQINSIVHPAVKKDFCQWIENQKSEYVLKESAILFESNAYLSCDHIIAISVPVEIRIERVMKRDKCSRESVLKIIDNQLSEKERISRADYVITNHSVQSDIADQALQIHNLLTSNKC